MKSWTYVASLVVEVEAEQKSAGDSTRNISLLFFSGEENTAPGGHGGNMSLCVKNSAGPELEVLLKCTEHK